jgi:hypothetical protein
MTDTATPRPSATPTGTRITLPTGVRAVAVVSDLLGTSTARVRSLPNGGTVIAALPKGTVVQVLFGQVNVEGTDWWQVRLRSGTEGWMASFLLKVLVEREGGSATPVSTQPPPPTEPPPTEPQQQNTQPPAQPTATRTRTQPPAEATATRTQTVPPPTATRTQTVPPSTATHTQTVPPPSATNSPTVEPPSATPSETATIEVTTETPTTEPARETPTEGTPPLEGP